MPGAHLCAPPESRGPHQRLLALPTCFSRHLFLSFGLLCKRKQFRENKSSEIWVCAPLSAGGEFSGAPIRENGSTCLCSCPQDNLGHRLPPLASLLGEAVEESSELRWGARGPVLSRAVGASSGVASGESLLSVSPSVPPSIPPLSSV